ncbi:putative aminoglycoside phosphotransferase [Mycolicibacterium chitae]|uniref:Putative acyl-CoA dehydrogenase n=1 Tax=Mycolicibacterium chitae TaxID=1792 RepID=A0A448I5R6_MYCCI|nr:phosphotransferase family protein [Mycolicibacterium chitae]MCV7104991.1 phosphotransferase family protein [Mycolicibacterium chitae]BBZ04210.1 putative aminoglycoside phosphotransferase [Mycolicibacterium chitae]VEG47859.1 putative acyl-CoA dehydrogenase [Mycolicibacterium chitae]
MSNDPVRNESVELTAAEVAALTDWLASSGIGAGDVSGVRPVGGGTQNIMVQFDLEPSTYILRRGPRHLRPRSNDAILRESRVLNALAGTRVPHPRTVAVCDDPTVLGDAVFYLMERVDGFNPSLELPALHAGSAQVRRDMGLHLMDALAALGEIDYLSAGLDGFGKPQGFLERQVPRWMAELNSFDQFDGYGGPQIPGVDRVASWLEANLPQTWRPGILHGDFHFANAMFKHDSAEVAAIVDWEMSTIGDPLLDLGWVLATWQLPGVPGMFGTGLMSQTGLATPEELVARYAAGSDRNLDAIAWYVVLACFKLGIVLEGTHARACAGLAPEKTGEELHQTTVLLFERAINTIKEHQ